MCGCFTCPICGEELVLKERTYLCNNNHTFDVARSGYVNLLLSNKSSSRNHGDNKKMIQGRCNFLNRDYYLPLVDALCASVKKYSPEKPRIFDAGCGECYYTEAINKTLPGSEITGIDISKDALIFGAKRCREFNLAVASLYDLPLKDGYFDILISVFSPYADLEFARVLKRDGKMIMVIPTARHLFGLKEILYDTPYENKVSPYELPSFELIEKTEVKDRITLQNSQDIENLFSMTPYYYRTPNDKCEKLLSMDSLTTEIAFEVLVYKKK